MGIQLAVALAVSLLRGTSAVLPESRGSSGVHSLDELSYGFEVAPLHLDFLEKSGELVHVRPRQLVCQTKGIYG